MSRAALFRHWELGRHASWYLLAGGVTTLLQGAVFLALREPLGPHGANLVAIALTTVANTEFHRVVTFAGAAEAPARRHVQAVATFVFYAVSGSVALFALHGLANSPSAMLETSVLVATSITGGALRFVALRYWVFARRPRAGVKMAE